jgi:hypothetical protein
LGIEAIPGKALISLAHCRASNKALEDVQDMELQPVYWNTRPFSFSALHELL